MPSRMRGICPVLLGMLLAGCTGDLSPSAGDGSVAAQSKAISESGRGADPRDPHASSESGADSKRASPATMVASAFTGRRYLRTEASFVTGNAVSVQRAGDAIMSRDFSKFVRAFERDLAADREARDLTVLYRRAMDEQAEGLGYVTELACGLSLCIGAIRTRDRAGYQTWSTRFDADTRTPSYSYGESAVDMGQAGLETRFFFTIDPALNGLVAPAKPMKPPAS